MVLENEGDGSGEHYTYGVTWSSEDDEYVGICTEFALLSWLAPTRNLTLSGIRELVARLCLWDAGVWGENTNSVVRAHEVGASLASACFERKRWLANR